MTGVRKKCEKYVLQGRQTGQLKPPGGSLLLIKQKLRKISLLYQMNAIFKQRQQEVVASRELNWYRTRALRKGITVPRGNMLTDAVKKRLEGHSIFAVSKQKGELHIFLAYSLKNWEFILPICLRPFGLVSEFEWRSHGFDDNSTNWLQQRDVMNKAMLEAFFEANSEKSIDVVVGYLSGYNTDPKILREMSAAGAVIINFSWDDKIGFRGKNCGSRWIGPAALSSAVDLNLTNAYDSLIKYMVEGGLAIFWPEAAHPDFHRHYNTPFEFDVSFVGCKYGWRPKFIRKLENRGIKVACFGDGWENGPLSNEDMVKLYSRSRINLGFAGVGHSKKLMCLKGRDFEVPMSGGLYLTQDNPELATVYDVGKEILTYKDEKDCSKKIKWLLKNPDKAEKIREAGRERALKDHTWKKRFEDIFRLSGLID